MIAKTPELRTYRVTYVFESRTYAINIGARDSEAANRIFRRNRSNFAVITDLNRIG